MNEEKSLSAVYIIEETVETICDELCKYRDTADENNECDYMREHGACPLDRLC